VSLSRQDYIEIILDHHDNPRNQRRIEGAQIEASGGNPGCGDVVVVYLRLDEDGCVEEAAFQGEGCTISQAGASMLTENVVGKTLGEVREMSYEDVIEDMGREVVSSRTRCATLALSTMKAAIDDFSKDARAAQITQEAS
jgi:nitrogen fixation protein NifU and related proteins